MLKEDVAFIVVTVLAMLLWTGIVYVILVSQSFPDGGGPGGDVMREEGQRFRIGLLLVWGLGIAVGTALVALRVVRSRS